MNLTLTLPLEGGYHSNADLYKQGVKVLLGSLFMALAAQFIIPLQPVPITLQTFAALLLGGLLGKRQGSLSVMLYLVQIAVFLPVAAGGVVNPLVLLGPKAGYYFGMVMQAYLVGYYCEKRSNFSGGQMFAFLSLTCLIQLAFGSTYLALFLGPKIAFLYGFLPFIAGELIKSVVAMQIVLRFRSKS